MELPGADGGLEARARARDRQHRRHQARVDDLAQPAPHRRAGRRGRPPGRRPQRRDRARARPSARRSAATRTSTASRSRARPRSAGASCTTPPRANLKRVVLELGGKSPQVVFADAPDLDVVAANVAIAIFWNMGENCSAGSRLIVHRSREGRLLEADRGGARGLARRRPAGSGDPDRRDDHARPHGEGARLHRDRARRGRAGRRRRRADPRGDRRLLRPADDLRRRAATT